MLQHIMNIAAKLIKGTSSSRERITPILIDLYWLPVKAKIIYKLCVMVYQELQFGTQRYIKGLLKEFHQYSDMALRHDIDRHRLFEPRCNLNMDFRAFENSAPRLYNNLPNHIKNCQIQMRFNKKNQDLFVYGILRP
ncbi:uncharacterized protein LOC143040446 [Oratosquilla oratoria]|uniref:uncharacterized protein LOC143040446 n=1 Tax=Oratosquilla oratoria TaxID=337810 RepID=UPI003F75CC39